VFVDPATGAVMYRIRATSRPQAAFARVGQPIVRLLQARFRRHSADAMTHATIAAGSVARCLARSKIPAFVDEVDMHVSPYLSFNGKCEAAFRFYEECLGGQLGSIHRYAGSPLASEVPAGWQDKVMHGSVTIGELVLMGADVAPDAYEAPKGFSLSIQIKETADAERIYRELGKDGTIVLALQKTFWADRFGMVVDRFGTPWLINCEGAGQPSAAGG